MDSVWYSSVNSNEPCKLTIEHETSITSSSNKKYETSVATCLGLVKTLSIWWGLFNEKAKWDVWKQLFLSSFVSDVKGCIVGMLPLHKIALPWSLLSALVLALASVAQGWHSLHTSLATSGIPVFFYLHKLWEFATHCNCPSCATRMENWQK